MKPVTAKATPAATAVLRQATALFPKRKKLSDGLLPSLAHQRLNPNSDHNTGLAVDLTHDPKNGVDCSIIFEKLKKDKRVNYLIFDGQIWSRLRRKEGNRKYSGSNPHDKHLHISIDRAYSNDTSPWFPWLSQPKIVNQVKAKLKPIPKKKYNTDKSIISKLLNRNTTLVCTCTTCPIHKKGKK
jgi:hypothetical protein